MRLPSKSTPYAKSVIAYFAEVLTILAKGDQPVLEVYNTLEKSDKNLPDFLAALDCLYALGQLGEIDEEGTLHYVG